MAGAAGRENVGMSNHNPNEKLEPRKYKVSVALAIIHGLGGPKAIPKGAVDGKLVNIPARPYDHNQRTKDISRCALLVWHSLYSAQARTERRLRIYLADICEVPFEKNLAKSSVRSPYRKPTLVDRASSPRGTSDSSLRN